MRTSRLARSRLDRRNTLDCAILNQMIIEPGNDEKSRSDKRLIQQQREYERDQKNALATNTNSVRNSQRTSASFDDSRSYDLPSNENIAPSNSEPKCIESSSRFMSVRSRPVGCRISAPATAFLNLSFPKISTSTSSLESTPQTRREFHETFSNLIKLGSNDKCERNTKSIIISREEQLWQTEIKDMIWLELQANMADRTLEQQDKYLFTARQNIGELLREIMNYRFMRKHRTESGSSLKALDSGISSLASTGEILSSKLQFLPLVKNGAVIVEKNFNNFSFLFTDPSGFCFGCLNMYCKDCQDAQSSALRQVEALLTRLESAENLFPSNKAFGLHFPLYKSDEFINRVKCMCLWYNITQHHRLKIMILGKLLAKLQGKEYKWPLQDSDSSSGASSIEPDQEGGGSNEVKSTNNLLNPEDSATDSANSDESSRDEYGRVLSSISSWNKIGSVEDVHGKLRPISPYRKFIETVLKSRGLGKSLTFLHRLHNVVLRKAHVTLEKPGTEDDHEIDQFEDEEIPNIEPPMDKEETNELRRYGVWSEECKTLGLPPYISAFLFLSLIPLEVVHEFLKMKIETKPQHPNPLSLEQLIKELKEGLTLALIHRDRFNKHITTALVDRDQVSWKILIFGNILKKTLNKS